MPNIDSQSVRLSVSVSLVGVLSWMVKSSCRKTLLLNVCKTKAVTVCINVMFYGVIAIISIHPKHSFNKTKKNKSCVIWSVCNTVTMAIIKISKARLWLKPWQPTYYASNYIPRSKKFVISKLNK